MADATPYKTIPVKVYGTDEIVYTLVDADDYEHLSQFKWGLTYGYPSRRVYSHTVRVPGKRTQSRYACIYMHREIMQTPQGLDVDHINRNPLDNRRSNLRNVTHTQNMYNCDLRSHNTSGHRGVSWDKRRSKWRAYIGGTKGRVELGSFKIKADAVAARLAAEAIYIEAA